MKTRMLVALVLVVSAALLLTLAVAAQTPETPDQVTCAPQAPTRQGAWVDTLVFTEESSAATAVSRLRTGELDIYAHAVTDPVLYQPVLEDPDLALTESTGSYNELTFNPYGPTFNDGRLNPFSNARIREALNRLVDRNHIAQWIYRGLALPKFLPVMYGFPDYTRYLSTCQALAVGYAYDPVGARQVITTEMQAMGASLVGGKWFYNGQPITLIVLIRVEDRRRQIGDYVADQLESAGFTVDRAYKTSAEASPIWVNGDPADGLFHIYTGGWIATRITRDLGSNFDFFYTPRGSSLPLWQAYSPSPEFDGLALKLRDHDFADMAERDTLFNQALALSLDDTGAGSVHAWMVDQKAFAPRRAGTAVASDLAAGIAGSQLWPYVVRFEGLEGGTMRIAVPSMLAGPWNPVAGSNWTYDLMPVRATQDYAFVADPNDGMVWPQRAEQAEVVVQAGLPVTKTLAWVDLSFSPTVTVPADAWVDWDAVAQRFITAGEKYPAGLTARVKSTVYYPADLFTTVTWHDGSPLDLSDFVMNMIMQFDRGKPESAIYDESYVNTLDAFLAHFRGVRIASTDPLVIETYDDQEQLDAELNVVSWWPNYSYGPGAWHDIAVGVRAEAAGELAFSIDKAEILGVEWTNYIGGSSLDILANYMNQSATEGYVPYMPTLGLYVTPAEAAARWANLQAWYAAWGHFWVGTGPFYLEQASSENGTLTLQCFANFPDAAGKWDSFAAYEPHLGINHASGAPGSFLNVSGAGFPPGDTASLLANGEALGQLPVDTSGNISFTLNTLGASEGIYHIAVNVNPTAGTRFVLDSTEPVRPQEGELPLVAVPAGIGLREVYLPLVMRQY